MKKIKLFKLVLYLFIILLYCNVLFAQRLIPYKSNYNCNNGLTSTELKDLDSNGVYDTYSITTCNNTTVSTINYAICGIGDIRKWPPTGIPTRSVTANFSSNLTFRETFYNSTGEVISWFQKYENIDTVFYYEPTNQYFHPLNFDIDRKEESDNVTIKPNPAKDYVQIHYTVNNLGRVIIKLYSKEGIVLNQILNTIKSEGEYDVELNIQNLNDGYYYIQITNGTSTTFKLLTILK